LIAETVAGTWRMSPVRGRTPASTASRVTPEASVTATSSPSASSVTVVAPSRIVAA
jgi:hypothetical protein